MIKIEWPEFKEILRTLPQKTDCPVVIDRLGVIMNEEMFVESHIKCIDAFPKKEKMSIREKNARLNICKPHYDRLMAYYIIKTQLGAS